MGSRHQIGILKRDGLGKQRFDMENILTRSLYRVLNNTNQVPPHVAKNQSVDKMSLSNRNSTTIAVARPNNHQIGNSSSVDMDLQMRLLAQEICGRVERKYERKLDEARDSDRRETDRRLHAIKNEYEAKFQIQMNKLEKEKTWLLDQMAERERTLEHRMEMRSAEKEHDIAAKQRMVENRAIELTLNKENFDKQREEWQRAVAAEREELQLERERVEVMTAKTSERRRAEVAVEAEAKMWKKRTEELEQDADLTRRKIGEMMEENFRLRDQAGAAGQMRRELDVTMSSLNETREELAASKVEVRRTGDFDRVKEENEQLRVEIERLRLQSSQRIQSAIDETVAEYSAREAKWKKVAGLSQQKIIVLSEKLKDVQMERDVLRQEMKTMQKMVGRSGTAPRAPKSQKHIRSVSPSGSTSSSLSDGELEILNIRQRIQNLDEIAKELDASVEHFGSFGTRRQFNESNVELYDDFCRALHTAHLDDDGSTLQKTSSPQKPIKQKSVEKTEDVRRDSRHDDWLKRGMRLVSPTLKRVDDVRPSEVRVKSPEFIAPAPVSVPVLAPAPAPAPAPIEVPKEPEMSEFEKRLMSRSRAAVNEDDRRSRLMQLAEPEPEPEKPAEPVKEQPTSADNPMFAGVDPVMAEYMKKVLAARNQTTSAPSAPSAPSPRREVEVTLADELQLDELELDPPTTTNDDNWW